MKTVFYILALLAIGLLGYLLREFIHQRKSQVEFLDYNLTREEAALYQARVDSLKRTAEELRAKLESTGRLRRRSVQVHLELLLDEITALERTLEMWQKSIRLRSQKDLVRQTILLYGEASAAARALAADTLD